MCPFEIVVFGAAAVGKSTLILRLVRGYFVVEYDSTVDERLNHSLNIDKKDIQLIIIDTAGQNCFSQQNRYLMREGKGFLIVYSIDDRSSFDKVKQYHSDIVHMKESNDFPIVICGNKCDLCDDYRVISQVEGENLAMNLNTGFFETSAKNNVNVNEAFTALASKIVHFQPQTSASASHKICSIE